MRALASIVCCLLLQCGARAADQSSSPAASGNGSSRESGTAAGGKSPATVPGSPVPLQGGVRGAALLTKDGLKKLSETSRDLSRATLLVMHEVTRRQQIHGLSANVLPNGVVIPPIPSPSGTLTGAHLPARKHWLKIHMKEIGYNAQLLRNEIDALIVPDDKMSTISVPWSQVRIEMSSIEEHYRKLYVLTDEEKLNELEIGREAVFIHDLAIRVDKLRKQVADLLAK